MTLCRLQSIVLRSGVDPESPRTVPLSPVTVLVGPNNSGKSTALADLREFATRTHNQSPPPPPWDGGTVVSAATLSEPSTLDEVLDFLGPRLQRPEEGGTPEQAHVVRIRSFQIPGGSTEGFTDFSRGEIDPAIVKPEQVAAELLGAYTLALDGQQRFSLAQGVQSGRLDGPPTSAWMAIERDAQLFAEVDAMVFSAFEEHLVVQAFEPPQLIPALSPTGVPDHLRQSTSAEAIAAQQSATRLNELSDGVQVFCGMVAAVAALPHLLLLIDEPEAFLHPTLCRRLGTDLARIARDRDARLVAATHSADFLLGCLEEVPETTVLRLDYRKAKAASWIMEAAEVAQLSRDPLLRSSNSLQALFARSAVVCEADSDRAFYAEINRRLERADDRSGALDTTFLNAQNWQTTWRVAAPLRNAGVPVAVILDLETLASNEAWSDLVAMTGASPDLRDELFSARVAARDAISDLGRVATGGPFKAKVEGLKAFPDGAGKQNVEAAVSSFASVGIFLVTVGELERWLTQFGCTNKKTWVTDILGRLGSPGDAAYVPPGVGDVWQFVESISAWLEDPDRCGMPA